MNEEIKKDEPEQNGGIDDVLKAVFGAEAAALGGERVDHARSTSRAPVHPDTESANNTVPRGMDALLETMKRAQNEAEKEARLRLRRKGKDCLTLGWMCGLGVGSLIGAAITGMWIPIAVALGVGLSAAAGILVHKGLELMRE